MGSAYCLEEASTVDAKAMKDNTVKQVSGINLSFHSLFFTSFLFPSFLPHFSFIAILEFLHLQNSFFFGFIFFPSYLLRNPRSNSWVICVSTNCDFFCGLSVGSSRPSSRGDRPRPAGLRKKSRQKKSHQELLHHYKLHRRRHAA